MSIIKTPIHIGIPTPIRLVHMTDTHLCLADMRDGERKVTLGIKRTRIFADPEKTLTLASETAKMLGTPILHTGDLIDFVSTANLEFAEKFTDENDVFMAAGNHEFSLYVGEAKEDAAYRSQSLEAVQKAFKNDIRMSSRVIGGVNFVALDNSYYLFEEEQLAFLKKEAEKALPIVLLMHNPIYEKTLYHLMRAQHPCAYLVGVPDELMQDYPQDRFEQQHADAITQETINYIKTEPLIRAIIAGHIHLNYSGYLTERIPQITTSCTDIRMIEID